MKNLYIITILAFILCVENSCKSKQEVMTSSGTETMKTVKGTGNNSMDMGDKAPVFSKGNPMAWVASNVKYPVEAIQKNIQGKVFVRFIIDINGNVVRPEVARGSGSSLLDKAAVEVVSRMPKWIPGRQKGKNVAVSYTLPINFSLSRK